MKRTHTCGELRAADAGKQVSLCGWVQSIRDHGGLIFINLRDRYGITQVVFDPSINESAVNIAEKARKEWVICARGRVELRPEGSNNPNLSTGDIEVICDSIEVLNESKTPPIEVADDKPANEEVRLRYRYIDLRRTPMQRNLEIRHKAAQAVRKTLNDMDFLEIQTPMFVRSTPEGARDFVVPSRLYPGKFYALPQSPQLYKQLLMVSGCDRYYQLPQCFRDEDQRSERQLVHTQIDLEMSFCDEEDIYNVIEKCVTNAFREAVGVDIQTPFPRMTYDEAMRRYGLDKPDTRFGMELCDISEIVARSEFEVFRGTVERGGQVKGLNAKGCASFTRREIDELTEFVKIYRAKGLAWIKVTEDGFESSIAKFLTEDIKAGIAECMNAEPGDLLLFVADTPKVVAASLGWLRNKLARKLELIPEGLYNFVWITEFPMFEWNDEENRWEAMHHMFTAPRDEDMPYLESDPGKVKGRLYDLVLNGVELGSGSIRINRPDVQAAVMNVAGMSREEADSKFGFLLKAFEYGAPPHGGMALGLDRLIMLMTGIENMRDVIAFPQNSAGVSLVDDAPSEIDERQWKELHLRLDIQKK